MRRRMIAALVFGLAGVAVLVALGNWQMRRLAWKTDIIETIETRLAADPVAVPADPDPDTDRYRRVRATGEVLPGEVHVYTSVPPHGVGYRVIVPFALGDSRTILLDRGFVPLAEKDAPRLLGALTVEGALDWPRETDGVTPQADLERNIWLARDVDAMAAELGTAPVLVVTEASDDASQPLPQPVSVNIPNNHLGYAVQWYGLAAVWALMTLLLLWRIKRRAD